MTGGNPAPWNRAPIQGLLLPDGSWTGAGASPNFLYTETNKGYAGNTGVGLSTPAYTVTGYDVSVVDSGPLKEPVMQEAGCSFNRPQIYYASKVINPAGPGHYTIIVTLYANSKSVLIDEDTDMQSPYYLPALRPAHARYGAASRSELPGWQWLAEPRLRV